MTGNLLPFSFRAYFVGWYTGWNQKYDYAESIVEIAASLSLLAMTHSVWFSFGWYPVGWYTGWNQKYDYAESIVGIAASLSLLAMTSGGQARNDEWVICRIWLICYLHCIRRKQLSSFSWLSCGCLPVVTGHRLGYSWRHFERRCFPVLMISNPH